MNKSPVIQITDALPHDVICERLLVKPRSIRLARERKVFPANWYPTMKSICAEYGVDCPESAFNWKSPSTDAPLSGDS